MNRPVQVSIIIVNFNSGQYITDCLRSIYDHIKGVDFEIIVVDNGSTDSSVRDINARFRQIRLIANAVNLGFGAANNKGAGEAAGDYLFFLNPDTVLMSDCVSSFIRFLSGQGNEVVSCGARLEKPGGGYSVSYGHFPSILQQFSDIGFRVLYRGFYDKHLSMSPPWNFDAPQQVGYLSGADIFIKKDIFLKMGGFDERFFMYYEDTDLFLRLSKEGYKTYILPGARIVHHGDTPKLAGGSFNYEKYAMTEKSRYLYFAKNRGSGSVFWIKAFQLLSLCTHYFGRYRYNLCKTWVITLKS